MVVLDNLSTGRRENLDGVLDAIRFVEGSITDLDTVTACCEGVDCVFHQAALPSVPRSVADPLASNEHNITGTLQVFWGAHRQGVRRVVFASSSSVYGNTEELPKHEGMKLRPMSPYAVNKAAGELYGAVFNDLYGLSTVGLRYFNVFGPRQDPNSQYAAVVPKFITAFLAGEAPVIHGDGLQSRDFTYIRTWWRRTWPRPRRRTPPAAGSTTWPWAGASPSRISARRSGSSPARRSNRSTWTGAPAMSATPRRRWSWPASTWTTSARFPSTKDSNGRSRGIVTAPDPGGTP